MAYCILKRYNRRLSAFEAFWALKDLPNCFFLDSSISENTGNLHRQGRYSFIGAEPFDVLGADGPGALTKLRKILNSYKIPAKAGQPPFLSGAVGFLSYELGLSLEEKTSGIRSRVKGLPGCLFALYNSVIIIDHLKNAVYISCVGFPEKKYSSAKRLAEKNLEKITGLLDKPADIAFKQPPGAWGLRVNFKKSGYLAAVRRAKDYIRRGDIYQVNLSQCFEAKVNARAADIYGRLRRACPTHFGAYFDAGPYQLLSASPERFLKLENRRVYTRPMKGTRPRSPDKKKDSLLRRKLFAAEKDKAELMMIVDLERNDLGRACVYDSVKVDGLRQLEEYATVFQTTSTISGLMRPDKDRIDLIRACFPGGSITGCPKIRAIQIIRELERGPRGIYTGAFGYLGFNGNMDLNILIRTILKKKNRVYFSVGGGIVSDSLPEEEYKETLVKAKAILETLDLKK